MIKLLIGNDDNSSKSIFYHYYENSAFLDRYTHEPEHAVDVIIPVIHTNELWTANLFSIFREIPVERLLIGDGGCIDNSIDIAKQLPRVEVLDHRLIKSLGYSVRKLIEAVKTEWFIYLHSDVYLPPGWFDVMQRYQKDYDWFGCMMKHTIMVEYPLDYGSRPWAGSQMGRKRAFKSGLQRIDDDYVYRQEDFIFSDIVQKASFKEGFVQETFHYHQTMHRPSPWFREVTSVRINVDMSPEEQYRTWYMELRGSIKYLNPSLPWAVHEVFSSMQNLIAMKRFDWDELRTWTAKTNRAWLRYVSREWYVLMLFRSFLSKLFLAFIDQQDKTPLLIPAFVRRFMTRKN